MIPLAPIATNLAIGFGQQLLGGLFGRKKAAAPKPDSRIVAAQAAADQRTATMDRRADEDRSAYTALLDGGDEAFNTSFASMVKAGMPDFRRQLQLSREGAQRRGISTGDLGTAYEGSIMSAFDANTKNAAASQAANLYGQKLSARQGLLNLDTGLGEASRERGLSILSGQLDRETAADNARRMEAGQNRAGLMGLAGDFLGSDFGKNLLGSLFKRRANIPGTIAGSSTQRGVLT